MKPHKLISEDMREQNKVLHSRPEGYGGSGWRHRELILDYAKRLRASSILDYGCGQGSLRKKLKWKYRFSEYDPAIVGKDTIPVPADLVVCTDVLEHIEPDKLKNVIDHLLKLTRKGCFAVIATRPASKFLPDGQNAHLIIEPPTFWLAAIVRKGWRIERQEEIRKVNGVDPHEVRLWLRRNK